MDRREPEQAPQNGHQPEAHEEPFDDFRCTRFCRMCLDICGRLDYGFVGNHDCKITPYLEPGHIVLCRMCISASLNGSLLPKAPGP